MNNMTEGVTPLPNAEGPRTVFWSRMRLAVLWILALGVSLVGSVAAFPLGVPLVWLPALFAVLLIGQLALWMAYRLLRKLLWRLSRRLAFTYFLVGVLPIPMFFFLIGVAAYLMGGFYLGHLFRSALTSVHQEVTVAAETLVGSTGGRSSSPLTEVAMATYEGGKWVGGDPRAPEVWPEWLEREQLESSDMAGRAARVPPLIALDEDIFTVAAAARVKDRGVVAFFDGHLETRLRELSGAWIELLDSAEASGAVTVQMFGERLAFQPLSSGRDDLDRSEFLSRGGADSSFQVRGFDLIPEVLSFDTGEVVGEGLSAYLAGTTTFIRSRLFPSAPEVDTAAFLSFVLPAFLLFDVFAVAWIMALLMIVGLSMAVNRLSRATSALQAGDFSVRISVRRKDQIGELQSSFNSMAEGLESSVASLAEAEIVEKELAMARDLQKSLIPSEVVQGAGVEFATFFEPSAAIGGDYFDILHLDARRLAVVIADVSGHGLSAGLHMAMLKAALLILVEEHDDPRVILQQLDRVVRSSQESHLFVTATLAFLDLSTGRLDLTNAGHPPTYVVREGGVEEVLLPGAPLGALGHSYGAKTVYLAPGDTAVWLSDGFIETANARGELFGYDRTQSSLEGDSSSAAAVRDRLLGLEITEKDWVVVGASQDQMIASGYTQVGRDFPVFLHPTSKEEYALARRERKINPGHTGFEFDTDVTITLEEDLSRRDLTINAIAEDDRTLVVMRFEPTAGEAEVDVAPATSAGTG